MELPGEGFISQTGELNAMTVDRLAYGWQLMENEFSHAHTLTLSHFPIVLALSFRL